MSENLSNLRTKLVPKPKFTFKSRRTLASASLSSSNASVKTSDDTTKTLTTTATAIPSEPVDQTSRFMKFENRANEHLFIGTLHKSDPSDNTMEQDVYLGGMPIDMETIAASRAQHHQQRQQTVEPKDVALTNLTDCTINLVHNAIPLGAIHIKNLKRCTLVIPPVSGSILLHDCEGCTLIGACHQVKTRPTRSFQSPFLPLNLLLTETIGRTLSLFLMESINSRECTPPPTWASISMSPANPSLKTVPTCVSRLILSTRFSPLTTLLNSSISPN